MAQTYGDWIRSNPPLPTKRYKKEHMKQETSKIGNSDKSQTAVEWLFNMIKLKADSIPTNTSDNRRAKGVYVDCLMLIKEAKDMEKEQHGNTWDSAIHAHDDRGHVHARSIVDFDEYFEDTYKK